MFNETEYISKMFDAALTPKTQEFHQKEADTAFPQGCKCGNNGGGDCDWCQIYYGEISE